MADSRPRILVTNDDGIDAPGIHALAAALREIADVTVIAPDTNRTAMSMSSLLQVKQSAGGKFTTIQPHKLTKVNDSSGALFGYSLDVTPADCVLLGLEGIVGGGPFDFVISGVNDGINLGRLMTANSGTIGAAAIATSDVKWKVQTIAVSAEGGNSINDYTLAANVTRQVVEKIGKEGFPKGVVLSINVPKTVKGVRTVPLGPGAFFVSDPIKVSKNGEFDWSYTIREELLANPGTDYFEYFAKGNIVLTPIRVYVDETNLLDTLNYWNLNIGVTNVLTKRP